jgi:hypothetical protein
MFCRRNVGRHTNLKKATNFSQRSLRSTDRSGNCDAQDANTGLRFHCLPGNIGNIYKIHSITIVIDCDQLE